LAREVLYEILRAEDTRERHYHKTERGRVIAYSVQLEVFIEGQWRPVIRYDCAHGYAHLDRYNIHGETSKEEVPLSFAEALTTAEEDLEQNWKVYRERFLGGMFP
jgi:hypothetical protein